jgi:DNA-binding transcriptional LysR family regulator
VAEGSHTGTHQLRGGRESAVRLERPNQARLSRPSALGRFAKLHPGVKLEVEAGVSAELIEQLNAGRLDVVFAKRPLGTSKGRLMWREPLVWAAADTFDLVPGAALPLALYRERSVSREAALAALNDNELS